MAKKVEDIAEKRWAGLLERKRKKKVKIEWNTKKEFVKWFKKEHKNQDGKCFYCGLPCKVSEHYEKQLRSIRMWAARGFRKGNRGKSLEIDRKKPKQPYNEDCVLVCYPCNNAKSDVFTGKEFKIIGAVIGVLKGKGKTKRIKKLKMALKKL